MKECHEAVDEIRPYVVRIETKSGRGTGFCCARRPEYDWGCVLPLSSIRARN